MFLFFVNSSYITTVHCFLIMFNVIININIGTCITDVNSSVDITVGCSPYTGVIRVGPSKNKRSFVENIAVLNGFKVLLFLYK